ncbi:MAG: DNA-binding response OmpR family regulator, partial [Candidatus Omnitrophota bacterium]
AMFKAEQPDLVLLDIELPGLSGYELLQAMRKEHAHIPVIMVSGKSEEIHRIYGLELGADDYVTKPFSVLELIARIGSVLRRSQSPAAKDTRQLLHGPLLIDEDAMQVTYFDQSVKLTRAEFKLLTLLVRHPARVFERDSLIDAIYSSQHVVEPRSVDATVKRLRKKLNEVRDDLDPIESVYGEGYKLRHGLAELNPTEN